MMSAIIPQTIREQTALDNGLILSARGDDVEDYDPSYSYLSNPRDKAFKKNWKGADAYVDFGPYRSKVMMRGQSGGVPICYLKGGPGSAPLSSGQKRYWQPEGMRIVMSSWRGCGDSAPLGGIETNTTQDLVEDIEVMRKTLNVPALLLAGQCWGATVAFKYAAQYPERTLGIVAMLPYLARKVDIEQSFGPTGIAQKYPDRYNDFTDGNPKENTVALFDRYARALSGDPREAQTIRAMQKWLNWEMASSGDNGVVSVDGLDPDNKQFQQGLAGERINVNYVRNGYFLPADGVVGDLAAVNQLAKLGKPVMYVAHRKDPLSAACYMETLTRNLPDASRVILENTDWHWIAPGGTAQGQSSYPIENAFAFMVRKAASRVRPYCL